MSGMSATDQSKDDQGVLQPETQCSRCGLPFGDEPNRCRDYTGTREADWDGRLQARIECRDRELGNVRALLRGSTLRLERCRDMIDDILEVWA